MAISVKTSVWDNYQRMRRAKRMSLVTAVVLDNDDVLFVSDRRQVDHSRSLCASADETGIKIVSAFGGVIGYAGDSQLALSLLKSIAGSLNATAPSGELEQEIGRRMSVIYNQTVEHIKTTADTVGDQIVLNAWLNDHQVEFLFAVRTKSGCRLTKFSIPTSINPSVMYDTITQLTDNDRTLYSNVHIGIVGVSPHALMILQWLNKKSFTLIEAQRLAVLMIAITNGANPSLVNNNIDMRCMTRDGVVTVSESEVGVIKEWVAGFMAHTKTALFDQADLRGQ